MLVYLEPLRCEEVSLITDGASVGENVRSRNNIITPSSEPTPTLSTLKFPCDAAIFFRVFKLIHLEGRVTVIYSEGALRMLSMTWHK